MVHLEIKTLNRVEDGYQQVAGMGRAMNRTTKRHRAGLVVLFAATSIAPLGAQASAVCAPAEHPGGDWPMYGHDLAGTRSQPDESVIGPSEAMNLSAAWSFQSTTFGGGGFSNTPVIGNGCLYVATNTGNVAAFNADSGELVWKTTLSVATPGGNGGAIVGSVAYDNGKIFVLVNQMFAPYAIALDANTGAEIWKTVVDTDDIADYANASPVVYDGMLFYAMSGPDSGSDYSDRAHQRYYILDTATGDILENRTIISQRDYDAGHRGGAIWATPAIDEESGFLYVGTGNPVARRFEHKYDNAIIKIDLNRNSQTFGDIVDAYKGEPDNYVAALYGHPVCEALGDDQRFWYGGGYSAACVQQDLDFGSSPNLWRDDRGDLVVGSFQKSGVMHAARGDTMQPVWNTTISAPSAIGNAGSTATDGETVYLGANPGIVAALDTDTGLPVWVSPTADGVRYQGVSVANGVVYTVDTAGAFDAFDAATGVPLMHRPTRLDTGQSGTALSSSGVAIARNTIYVALASSIIAYRVA
jgi:polyvinyl alcohol dehydrogenase (cytochrome)